MNHDEDFASFIPEPGDQGGEGIKPLTAVVLFLCVMIVLFAGSRCMESSPCTPQPILENQ